MFSNYKKLFKFRGKIFSISMLSSVLVLIAFSFISVSLHKETLQNEIIKKNMQLLRQNKTVFSTQHNWLIAYIFQLESQPELSRVIYGKKLSLLNISRGFDAMNEAFSYCPYLDSITVINKDKNILLSTIDGLKQGDQVLAAFRNVYENVNRHGLFQYTLQEHSYPQYRFDQPERSVLSICVSKSRDFSGVYSGFMVVNLNLDKLRQLFIDSDEGSDQKDVLILDPQGEIVSGPTNIDISLKEAVPQLFSNINKNRSEEGYFFYSIGNSEKLITYNRAEYSGWTFLSLSDIDSLIAPIENFWRIIRLAAILALLVLIAVNLSLSGIISAPVENLYHHAREIGKNFEDLSSTEDRSEVLYADAILKGIQEKTLSLNAYVKRQDQYYVRELLGELIRGQISWEQLDEEQRGFLSEWEDFSGRFYLLSVEADSDSSPLFWDYVNDHFQPLIPAPALKLNIANDRILFMGGGDSPGDYVSLLDQVYSETNVLLTLAVSRRMTGIDGGFNVYQDLCRCADYRFLSDSPAVFIMDSFSFPEKGIYSLRTADVTALWLSLFHGQKDKFRQLEELFVKSLSRAAFEDFVYSRKLLFHLLKKLIKERELNDSPARDKMLEKLYDVPSLSKLEALLDHIYRYFNDEGSKDSPLEVDFVTSVLNFIEENFSDPSLCPDSISTQFKVSKSYLRHVFKSVTNQNISAFISSERLKKSRKLLMETDLSVREVATAVGMGNYNYFFSCFRKETGLTPRDYRIAKQIAI